MWFVLVCCLAWLLTVCLCFCLVAVCSGLFGFAVAFTFAYLFVASVWCFGLFMLWFVGYVFTRCLLLLVDSVWFVV